MTRAINIVFVSLIAIVLFFFVVDLYYFLTQKSRDEAVATEQVLQEIAGAKQKFEGRLTELMAITERLANEASQQLGDSTFLLKSLRQNLVENEDVFGLGVAYVPKAFDPNKKLFAPFFIRRAGEIELQFIEESYDYTDRDWFTKPIRDGKAWFEPPYYGEVAQTIMAEYSVPIYHPADSSIVGIVFLDYSLDDITKAVDQLELGKSGYGMMFSKEGVLIAHPQAEKVLVQETIKDFAKEWKSNEMLTLFDSLEVNGKSYVQAINTVSGMSCRIFLGEIEVSSWRLGAVFVEDAFKTDSVYINQVAINLTSAVVIMCLIIFLYFLYRFNFKGKVILKMVPFVVAVFLSAIGVIWYSKIYQPFNIFQQKESYPIVESTGLKRFLDNQDSLRSFYHEPEIVKIPTGIFLKHIEFDGSHNVQLSGVIWQKYSNKIITSGIEPDLRFLSTAPDAEAQSIEEMYRKREGEDWLVGWEFRVEVREKMHYGLYPLDREKITLALGHPDISQNIQLVPSLESYDNVVSTGLPGVDKNIILPEWETEQSYFDFQPHNYNVDFGVMSAADRDYKYNMAFNVILKRKFLWPSMANIIPLATISILLFLALHSTVSGASETKKDRVLFSGFGLLELCAAFLFVAILTHIDLRSNLVVNYIMYMDYFYFHVYFTIIICSLSAVLLNKGKNMKQIAAVKLLYWPLLLGSLFLFTAIRFY